MEELHFICTENSGPTTLAAEKFLYNSHAFLQLRAKKYGTPLSFYALRKEVVVAGIHFFLVKQDNRHYIAVSIPESPFGSLEYGDISSHEIQHLVAYTNEHLWSKGVDKIIIKDCIEAYRSGRNFTCEAILLGAGYQIKDSFVNHHIPVDYIPHEDKMQRMEQKRLRKCKRAMVHLQQELMDRLTECYHFLKRCRREKGWELSLSLTDLEQQLSQSPGVFCLFSVFHEDERIAAALCIKVNSGIIYNFYHESLAAYKSYSPVTLLLKGIYRYCQQAVIRMLDMGTSPSRSLQAFKEHCGGIASFKHTYQIVRK